VPDINIESKETARVKARRKMKSVYTWAHLEKDEDLNYAFKSDPHRSKKLADKLDLLEFYFNKRAG
jgi:uncharacterized protein involved in tolerance to divalent cations